MSKDLNKAMAKKVKIIAGLSIVVLSGVILYALFNIFGGPSEYVDFQIESQQSQLHRLALGEVRVISGDPESGIATQVILRGVVGKQPTINAETQETEVEIIFPKIGGEEIVTVSLGSNDTKMSTLLADGGIIPRVQTWRVMSASEISPLLINGDPIRIFLALDKLENTPFLMNPNCLDTCREAISTIREFYENNFLLVNAIEGGKPLDKEHKVGAVAGLIINR